MTQFDRIRGLSLEGMLDFIENEAGGGCLCCAYHDDVLKCSYNYNGYKCREGIKEWLKQEIK